ncbi:uncharacterized protein LOC131876599 [Cryptomeria japonica]|uniref:uncharacterized protein LOC131876599 n=1 Tax=Cryptomeria japonica TaxID=3369 RepID=UPI0027D9F10D|nr:uncharacterized protein LOC131876599 [Cryptomeria japonica]
MASLVGKTTSPEKAQEVGTSSNVLEITPIVPLSMIAPLKELQGAQVVESKPEPNPKADPVQTKEAEASAPLKKTKRKRESKKVTIVVSEESKEEYPTPKTTKKPTPKKRKSKKDGEAKVFAKEAFVQPDLAEVQKEEVAEKALEEPKEKAQETPKKELKKRTPPKNKVESSLVTKETPQPQEEQVTLAQPPKIVVQVEKEIVMKLEELARRQTRVTQVLSQDLLDLFLGSSALESFRIKWGDSEVGCRDVIMGHT